MKNSEIPEGFKLKTNNGNKLPELFNQETGVIITLRALPDNETFNYKVTGVKNQRKFHSSVHKTVESVKEEAIRLAEEN